MQAPGNSSNKKYDSDDSAGGSEATSKDTLSDIEENEADVDSGDAAPDPGPSPDGAFDDGDETKDAGPM